MLNGTPRNRRPGFTLVELMITVAIVGLLASIGIPHYIDMQYRSKRAEIESNTHGIMYAEVGYEAAYDFYIECLPYPTGVPGKKTKDWKGGSAEFKELGWYPDGAVRGQYSVTTVPGPKSDMDFNAIGNSDIDGDTNYAKFTATKSVKAIMITGADTY